MVQAIGSISAAGTFNAGSAVAGLEAQLARYQKQLSECVNCDSSKTSEGKAQIESISSTISDVKSRIDKVNGVNARGQTPALASSTNPEISNHGIAAAPSGKANEYVGQLAPTTVNRAIGRIGSNVDVLA